MLDGPYPVDIEARVTVPGQRAGFGCGTLTLRAIRELVTLEPEVVGGDGGNGDAGSNLDEPEGEQEGQDELEVGGLPPRVGERALEPP